MKKQHLFIILSVILLGFVFAVCQYYQALKTEDVSAVTVGIPNPGHSLAQLECSADSLCVDTTNNRVGIGTNNPIGKFQIQKGGGATVIGAGTYGNYIGSNSDGYELNLVGGIPDGTLQTNGSMGGQIRLGGSARGDGDVNVIQFLQNGSETMRVNNGGNVAIGTIITAGTTGTHLDFNSTNGSTIWGAGIGGYTKDYIDQVGLKFYVTPSYLDSHKAAMVIDPNGSIGIGTTSPGYTLTVAGNAWVTSGSWSGSDIRWKKNINTLSQSSSLKKVMALNPVNYQWKTDEYPEMKFSNGTQLGFIAQDVEKIIPEVVTTNNEGYKGISYEKIVPVLTSAIQEQEKKIEQLKAIVCLDHPLAEVCK